VKEKVSCNKMSNSVARPERETDAMPMHARGREFSLYSADGARKYLNQHERQRVLAEMAKLPKDQALFCLTLAWTGARVSEVLALTPSSFQTERGVVAIRTLKRREHYMREMPIPPELMNALDHEFDLSTAQRDPRSTDDHLWPWHRATAWRIIKKIMRLLGIKGRQACPKGLRHAFGVGSLQSGVPLNLVQRWLGHSRISTAAIYAAMCGPEEVAFARQFWRTNQSGDGHPCGPTHRDRL
jgi:site-specific recombinase XerD